MPGVTPLLCLVGVIVLIVIVFVASALKVVPEYQRLVVFRLGRCVGPKGPGLVILIPFVDRAVRVDLRELVREIPAQTSITLDNAPISIDFLWYYKVFDPVQSVLQVGNFEMAAQGIATTTLRSVIGGILLDDVLSQREKINQSLRVRLDEVTERWGVKVTNVEIREIIPPREVQELDELPANRRAHPPCRGDRVRPVRARPPSTWLKAHDSRPFCKPMARSSPPSCVLRVSASRCCCGPKALPTLLSASTRRRCQRTPRQ